MARTLVIAAAALLLGIFIGGVGPRQEVAAVKKELTVAQAQVTTRGRSTAAASFALGVGSLMAAQEQAREQAARAPRLNPPPGTDETPVRRVDERPGAAPAPADAGLEDRRRRPFGLGDPEAFKAATAAADLRAAQYRAAFLEEAHLPPQQQAVFEENIARMNEELAQAADELAAALGARATKVGPRDMADVGARVLDIYRRADDKFKAGLDDNARAALEKTDFDLLTQVDLGGLQRLAETVDQLGVSAPRGAP